MAEDRRIALAALAVTAVVGVAAPVGSVVATNAHDDRRLHAEQVQSDRAELRSVLDEAATALDGTQRRIFDVTRARGHYRPGGSDPRYIRLRRHFGLVSASYNRVAIRLGRKAKATLAMNSALEQSILVTVLLKDQGRHETIDQVDPEIQTFGSKYEHFIDVANRVAQSRTR